MKKIIKLLGLAITIFASSYAQSMGWEPRNINSINNNPTIKSDKVDFSTYKDKLSGYKFNISDEKLNNTVSLLLKNTKAIDGDINANLLVSDISSRRLSLTEKLLRKPAKSNNKNTDSKNKLQDISQWVKENPAKSVSLALVTSALLYKINGGQITNSLVDCADKIEIAGQLLTEKGTELSQLAFQYPATALTLGFASIYGITQKWPQTKKPIALGTGALISILAIDKFMKSNRYEKRNLIDDLQQIAQLGLTIGGGYKLFDYLRVKTSENRFSPYQPSSNAPGFNAIAGGREAIPQGIEILMQRLTQDDGDYQRFKLPINNGYLFYGPPGTGKTSLARALAEELKLNFFYVDASSLRDKFVGESEKKIRALYEKAEQTAKETNKKAIIFIDEIDAIGLDRNELQNNFTAPLTALLNVLDGFDKATNSNVITICGTNMLDRLDPALVRSGRLGEKIFIDLPNDQQREMTIKHYLDAREHYDQTILEDRNMRQLISITNGFSPADIKQASEKAAEAAVLAKQNNVTFDLVKDAFQEQAIIKSKSSNHARNSAINQNELLAKLSKKVDNENNNLSVRSNNLAVNNNSSSSFKKRDHRHNVE